MNPLIYKYITIKLMQFIYREGAGTYPYKRAKYTGPVNQPANKRPRTETTETGKLIF